MMTVRIPAGRPTVVGGAATTALLLLIALSATTFTSMANATTSTMANDDGITYVDLYTAGQPSAGITYPCYRQPVLISGATPGVLLGFAEGRNVSSCAPPIASSSAATVNGPMELGGLLLRRSTDGGASWSAATTLLVGNIDFYTAVLDSFTHVIWVMVQDSSTRDTRVLTSDDEGVTWSSGSPLSLHIPAPFTGAKPAVGHGIQLRSDLCSSSSSSSSSSSNGISGGDGGDGAGCAEAGRLIMPFVCTNGSAHGDSGVCEACHSCAVISDDHGKSWRLGGIGQAGSRESQLVQTLAPANSTHAFAYVSERNFGKTPGHRMYARTSDGASTFSGYGIDHALPSPVTQHWTGIVGSVHRIGGSGDSHGHNGNKIVYVGPADPNLRANLSVWISPDAGRSWGNAKTLWAGPAAYSDLQWLESTKSSPRRGCCGGGSSSSISSNSSSDWNRKISQLRRAGGGGSGGGQVEDGLGVIYENGNVTFADRISFSFVPASWFTL